MTSNWIRTVGFVPVLLIVALLGWIWYVYSVHAMIYYWRHTALGILAWLGFQVVFAIFALCYYRVIFTSPGTPPSSLHIHQHGNDTDETHPPDLIPIPTMNHSTDVQFSTEQVSMVTAKRDGRPRQCRKCNRLKPDRTHHCSICGQCVLKMDHHCPWINNCVGFRTQKFFLLFLIWAIGLSLYTFWTLLALFQYSRRQIFILDLQLTLLLLVAGVFALVLTLFTSLHVYYVLTNMTTIESFEKHRYKVPELTPDQPPIIVHARSRSPSRRRHETRTSPETANLLLAPSTSTAEHQPPSSSVGGLSENPWWRRLFGKLNTSPRRRSSTNHRPKYVNIFNLGWRENWAQVMGPRPLYWFFPVMNSVGDGLSFPYNEQAYEQLVMQLQPSSTNHNE